MPNKATHKVSAVSLGMMNAVVYEVWTACDTQMSWTRCLLRDALDHSENSKPFPCGIEALNDGKANNHCR